MSTLDRLPLSDDQLDIVLRHAAALQPADRNSFFDRVGEALRDVRVVGEGNLHRAASQAMRELLRARPIMSDQLGGHHAGSRYGGSTRFVAARTAKRA